MELIAAIIFTVVLNVMCVDIVYHTYRQFGMSDMFILTVVLLLLSIAAGVLLIASSL